MSEESFAQSNSVSSESAQPQSSGVSPEPGKKKILIGSQRAQLSHQASPVSSVVSPAAARVTDPTPLRTAGPIASGSATPLHTAGIVNPTVHRAEAAVSGEENVAEKEQGAADGDQGGRRPHHGDHGGKRRFREERQPLEAPKNPRRVELPNLREGLDADLEAEFAAMMGGDPSQNTNVESLLNQDVKRAKESQVELEAKCNARVVSVRKDCLFVELGGYEQGVLMFRSMPGIETGETPIPNEGDMIEVYVNRFNPEDGLYELTLPNAAMKVEDWSDLSEGLIVEAKITGHNKGGLECEVNHIRGFIPMGQVSLYRVDNPEEFVDEKWNCVITECNPQRRNLILSRRALLEREREAAKQATLASLEVGQVCEGVVRRLMPFGAFVEIGPGVDGLLHISQLGWTRVNHPSEVLSEGQTVRVRVEKIDEKTHRIGLSYKELLENPWDKAEEVYAVGSTYTGKVVKIMDFGAFVQLEPGVEGLIHISELAYQRVQRVADIVTEGQSVEVKVLSYDKEHRRIGLSMKACLAPPTPVVSPTAETGTEVAQEEEPELPPPAHAVKPHFKGQLKGGTSRPTGGDQCGLNW
ncbi:MAG: S1 RNA-binding domain-containing protein [Thermoguttaceae bacterium]|nr:S1 RNA-binding domain-containing protein [Thermoguttaceae bacterium]